MAEHGPLLRPDLGRVLLVFLAGAVDTPLPQVDREEEAGHGDREQPLDDRPADASVRERRYPSDSSHKPVSV